MRLLMLEDDAWCATLCWPAESAALLQTPRMAPSPPHASTAPPALPGQPSASEAPPDAAARAQAAGPARAPSQEALARQLQALGPRSLDGAVISQFLAGYQTGQLNTAGRPMLAVGPRLAPDTSETLPLVGEEHRSESLFGRYDHGFLCKRPLAILPETSASAWFLVDTTLGTGSSGVLAGLADVTPNVSLHP